MLKIEPRKERSGIMILVAPLLAMALTLVLGSILFASLGKDPVAALTLLFIQPFSSIFSIGELLIKATPLILIAIGLSFGFRAGIWNIGAEGQFVMGAIAGSAVGLHFSDVTGIWLLPLMCVAGTLAGMAWGAIPALLRVRFNANEILVSLMLTYVAILYLSAMIHGPLMARSGFNFPESELFHDAATMPNLYCWHPCEYRCARGSASGPCRLGIVPAACSRVSDYPFRAGAECIPFCRLS